MIGAILLIRIHVFAIRFSISISFSFQGKNSKQPAHLKTPRAMQSQNQTTTMEKYPVLARPLLYPIPLYLSSPFQSAVPFSSSFPSIPFLRLEVHMRSRHPVNFCSQLKHVEVPTTYFQTVTPSPLNVTLLEGLGGGGRGGEGGSPRDMVLGAVVICRERFALGKFRGAMSLLRVFLTDRRFSLETAILSSSFPPSSYPERKLFFRSRSDLAVLMRIRDGKRKEEQATRIITVQ
jgi:hypothetical protein